MSGERTVLVRFKGDPKSLQDASAKSETAVKGLGKTVDKVSLAIVAGGIGVAIGLEKIGESFDDAYDKIRIGTGKTGVQLDSLETSFKNVAAKVPASFDDVSTAIASLNERTGATGKTLEDLAATEIRLSQLMGTDLNSTIADSTRLFGDWSIKTGDQAATLDKVFRAAQATGVPIGNLMQTVVAFGGPLRQLGFSFDESVSMLAKWEKEGVNTELVLGGLKKALGTFAKQGKDPVDALKALIASLAGAKTSAQATQLAVAALGVKAGPDFAAAVREGRFSYQDLLTQIDNGQDTIQGAAGATDDWKEKLQELKNQAFIQLEPVASDFFDTVTNKGIPAMSKFLGFVKDNHTWLGKLAGAVAAVSLAIAGINLAVKGYTATVAAWNTIVGLATAAQWAWNVALDANPIGAIILAIGLIVIGIGLMTKGLHDMGYTWGDVWHEMVGWVETAYHWVTDTFWGGVVKVFDSLADTIMSPFRTAFDWIQRKWHQLLDFIDPLGLVHNLTTAVDAATASVSHANNGPQHRAAGGGVAWGQTYIVGEAGPELWTPGASGGSITPNASWSGGDTYVAVQIGDQPIRAMVRAERVEADRGTRAWVQASSGVAA